MLVYGTFLLKTKGMTVRDYLIGLTVAIAISFYATCNFAPHFFHY